MASPNDMYPLSQKLTLDEVKQLKEMLVSESEDIRFRAIEILCEFATSEHLDIIMKTDLVTLLCNAITSGTSEINSLIYECLSKLCRHERFFTDGHANFVGLTVTRNLKFLAKTSSDSAELRLALYLTADILKGHNKLNFSIDRKLQDHIIDIIGQLTRSDNVNINMILSSATVLCSLLGLKTLKLTESSGRVLFDSLRKCLNIAVVLDDPNSMDPFVDRAMAAALSLSANITRFLAFCGKNCSYFSAEERSEIIKLICEFTIAKVLPHIKVLPEQEILSFPEKTTSAFQYLNLMLMSDLMNDCPDFVDLICEHGILSFVIRVLPMTISGELHESAVQLFIALLTALSLNVFKISEMWSEGEEHFKAEVASGVLSLPADPSEWLSVLCDPSKHRSVKLAILLYLYYLILIEGSFNDDQTASAAAEFLNSATGLNSCPLLLKIIWPILALSQVNVGEEELVENLEQGNRKLTVFLEEQEDLTLVYTHHPGLLYHAFHSLIFPNTLQMQLLKLWLLNEPEVGKSLNELLNTSEPARFALLDLVLTAHEPLLTRAFVAYKSLLTIEGADEHAQTVWHLIPGTLAKLCGNALKAINVERLMELALCRPPQLWEQLLLERCASLLAAVIASLDIVPLSMWQFAHNILTIHLEHNDFRVATFYLRSEEFIWKLLGNFNSDEPEIVQISLKIAACLSHVQRTEDIPEIRSTVPLDPEQVIRLLQAFEPETRHRALLFVQELLDSQWNPPLCHPTSPPSPNLIRYLFFVLQNYCIQDSSDEVWDCLSSCLKLFPPNHPLTKQLVDSPWVPYLLQLSLPQLLQQQSLVSFIEVWVSLYQPPNFNSRRLLSPFQSQIFAQIAEVLSQASDPYLLSILKKIKEFPNANIPSSVLPVDDAVQVEDEEPEDVSNHQNVTSCRTSIEAECIELSDSDSNTSSPPANFITRSSAILGAVTTNPVKGANKATIKRSLGSL